MNNGGKRCHRVLAIDPVTKGFGFAVLEGPDHLVDWGVAHVSGEKHAAALQRIADLLDHYRPKFVVIEDWAHPGSRRRERIRELLEAVPGLAAERKVGTCRVPQKTVKRVFSASGPITKHEIAVAISKCFPELASRLPRPRKPWMSEDERMGIFDAVAFALVHYY